MARSDNKRKEQQSLLNELESIKSLLDDDQLDAIPLLEEMIDEEPLVEITPTTKSASQDPLPPGVLPGQQSLFSEKKPSRGNSYSNNKARGENPFLPPHIRNRLKGNNPGVFVADNTNTPLTDSEPTAPVSNQQIVDELIIEFLPKIEAELRKRLLEHLEGTSSEVR